MASQRPFVCDECSQTFTRNENLERHKRSRHEGLTRRPFECPSCQARFARRDVCKRHSDRCRAGSTHCHSSPTAGESEGIQRTATLDYQSALTPIATVAHGSPNIILGSPIVDGSERHSHSPNDHRTQSSAITVSSSRDDVCITAYFGYFHPSFPLLHRPTITEESPQVLRNIIIAIGSLYTAQILPPEEAASCVQHGQSLWDAGCQELSHVADQDWRELRRTWAMQAWLMHIIYGAFMGDAARYNKAKKMLRSLVDAAQDLGLLRQSVAMSASGSWARACHMTSWSEDGTLHELWMLYVNEESMKLAMYTLLFLDFHMFAPCNIRPLMSPLELEWELPLCSSLWESDTALLWVERLSEEPRAVASLEPDSMLNIQYSPTKSLTLATQSLMSESPSPQLLAALEASPIAALFILTNISAFVRDFTRCYYQLPPGLADPSAFHIFTQSQNRQVTAALREISRIVQDRKQTGDGEDGPLWTAVARLILSVKISLCRPDDLLIGGIVDSSVVAGLATATHLTLGLYAGARRSLQSLLRRDSGDDAILVMLDEVIDVLSFICTGDGHGGVYEAPWTTVATYRILLAIWRSLRWATGEMRRHAESHTHTHRRFEAWSVLFHAIMEVVTPSYSQAAGTFAEWDGLGPQSQPPEADEQFTRAVLRFWKDRSVWPIGASMTTVLDEIISAGY